MIIDTHVHIVAPDQSRYPRKLARDNSAWVIDMSGERMLQLMTQAGIDRAVLVQAHSAYEYDNSYVADVAASYPERVLAVPAPNALIMAFGESAIELELRFWIQDAQNGVHNVKSQVLYEIWRLFQQQGIRIPYPKRDLYVRSDAPATFAEAADRRHRRS